jgi:hypothetical protein
MNLTIKAILNEMGLAYETESSGQTVFVCPQWRVTTQNGANIWGTWNTYKEADEACTEAKRLGHTGINLAMRGIGIVDDDDGQFMLIHSDDGMPILRADIGDGATLRTLLEQFQRRDNASEFHTWAQGYAQIFTQDTTLINH